MASFSPAAFTSRDALRNSHFRRFLAAQLVSVFGDLLALFGAISLITFHLHGNALQVTTLIITYILPLALLGPVAGVLADRWNMIRVMVLSDLVRAALVLLLIWIHDFSQMCFVFAGISAVSSLFAPAQAITLRCIMPQSGLLAANALMGQAFYLSRIASPALAGWLISWFSEKSCFYIDAVSFVISAALLITLKVQPPEKAQERKFNSLVRDFMEGNRFIFSQSTLALVLMAMSIAILAQSSFTPLIAIYTRDWLSAGAISFGIVTSMIGFGLIGGTQLVNRVAQHRSKPLVVLTGLLVMGIGAVSLGISRNLPAAGAGTFILGFSLVFVLVPAQALSQEQTPAAMMGRVSSSFLSLISAAQVAGLLLSGYLARILGIRLLFIMAGAILIVLGGTGYVSLRLKFQTTPVAAPPESG